MEDGFIRRQQIVTKHQWNWLNWSGGCDLCPWLHEDDLALDCMKMISGIQCEGRNTGECPRHSSTPKCHHQITKYPGGSWKSQWHIPILVITTSVWEGANSLKTSNRVGRYILWATGGFPTSVAAEPKRLVLSLQSHLLGLQSSQARLWWEKSRFISGVGAPCKALAGKVGSPDCFLPGKKAQRAPVCNISWTTWPGSLNSVESSSLLVQEWVWKQA